MLHQVKQALQELHNKWLLFIVDPPEVAFEFSLTVTEFGKVLTALGRQDIYTLGYTQSNLTSNPACCFLGITIRKKSRIFSKSLMRMAPAPYRL